VTPNPALDRLRDWLPTQWAIVYIQFAFALVEWVVVDVVGLHTVNWAEHAVAEATVWTVLAVCSVSVVWTLCLSALCLLEIKTDVDRDY
jgi:predicted oxidoreductase